MDSHLFISCDVYRFPFVCTTALVADGWANAIRESISTIITTVVRKQKAEMAAAKKK